MKEFSESELAAAENFEPTYLRLFTDRDLSDRLFSEAYDTLNLLEGDRRQALEEDLLALSWIPTAEDERNFQTMKEALHEQLDEELASDPGEELATWQEASLIFKRKAAGQALWDIARIKHQINAGLASGRDEEGTEWSEDYTLYGLKKICEAQDAAGINYASDYVRQIALTDLKRADYRAAALLINAGGGDQASLEIGLDFLKEALIDKEATDSSALIDCFDALVPLMAKGDLPESRWRLLRDLSLDTVAALRQWRLYSRHTEKYATAAVTLAILCRDRQAL